MTLLVVVYSLNGTLLLVHEIESAFEKEWEILRLPGGINGFVALHVPIILLLFYGLIEQCVGSHSGLVFGVIFGLAGTLPVFIHDLLVRRKGHFDRVGSRIVMYLNLVAGITLIILSRSGMANR